MVEDDGLKLYRIENGTKMTGYWSAGYYTGKNEADAISRCREDHNKKKMFLGYLSAEEVRVEGFRLTLSTLEEKASK